MVQVLARQLFGMVSRISRADTFVDKSNNITIYTFLPVHLCTILVRVSMMSISGKKYLSALHIRATARG